MHYVVGSGPSGIAVTHALLARGLKVTMLDIGRECEVDNILAARSLAQRAPEAWDSSEVAKLRGELFDVPGPRKLLYGSDFAYADDRQLPLEQTGTRCLHSGARGGLSNVWGASVLPASPADFADWPVSAEAMAPHYAAVARLLEISGAHDELERLFPYHAAPAEPLRLSRQAGKMLARMQAHRECLGLAGIHFGRSRLAVRTLEGKDSGGCRHVGLCLTGCPYMAIWNAAAALAALMGHEGFSYQGGVRVTAVESFAGGVRIQGTSTQGEARALSWQGRSVYLACGPLSSSAIVLRSLAAPAPRLELPYQPYFIIPLLALENTSGIEHERLHTLAQLYLEIMDGGITRHPVHLQLYGYNDFIQAQFDKYFGRLGPLTQPLRRMLLGRLLVVQGYLDSAEAAGMRVEAQRGADGVFEKLALRAPPPDRQLTRKINRLVGLLTRHCRRIGAMPIRPMLRIGVPGEGNHIGGIFPMREVPGQFQSDVTGQMAGLPGVHIVDASVLPRLPAASYTYTIMANAHRIGSMAPA